MLGDATFNRFVSSFAWWDVFGTGLGMRSNSALGSVRVGVTEIGVNRMFELLFSMHPFQRKTIFFSTQTFQNYFHSSVTSSQPVIRKNRFICKLASHIYQSKMHHMLACLDYSRIQDTILLWCPNSSVLSKSKYEMHHFHLYHDLSIK